MVTEILFSLPPPPPPNLFHLRRVYTMRQKHATMRRASKSHYVNRLIATCDCRKKVGWFQLSCDSMQQSHVAQISPFTQRDFVARRISHQFLSHRVNAPLRKRKRIPRFGNHLILQSVIYNIYICIIAVPYQGSSPMLKQAELKDSRFVKDLQSQPHPSLRHRHLY